VEPVVSVSQMLKEREKLKNVNMMDRTKIVSGYLVEKQLTDTQLTDRHFANRQFEDTPFG
jgi:hypothetical protein